MDRVFTNGVFDLLHVGHIRLLKWAKLFGDELIVGINSDASAAKIKGCKRPIIPENERLEILRSFDFVDDVIIFYEDTPEKLIRYIRPRILVKGPECIGKEIPGEKFVISLGGSIDIPDWEITQSTSNIINQILQKYAGASEINAVEKTE